VTASGELECRGHALTRAGGDANTQGRRGSGSRQGRPQEGQRESGQSERADGTKRHETLYPVTGTGRVATVTRLLKLASVPDGVDAVVVMIQVPSLRRTVHA
jgi:hypothetical protein